MLNNALLSREISNIGNKYFGIAVEDFEYAIFIDDSVPEVISLNENPLLISKNEAINLAKKIYNYPISDDVDLYISANPMEIGMVKNDIGQYVFKDISTKNISAQNSKKGWLIFCDLCNKANWGHECEYLFIIDTSNYFVCKDVFAPSSDMNIKECI